MELPDGVRVEFTKDNLPVDFDEHIGGNCWAEFRKVGVTRAIKIERPFSVQTIHAGANQDGQAGDWLALDSEGYPYPIAASVFEETYEPTSREDEPAAPDGWQGTTPPDGTRRAAILETIRTVAPSTDALALADAIEERLLRS